LVKYFNKLDGGDYEDEDSDKYHTAFYWQKSATGQMFCVSVVAIAHTAAAH
jgi:hypothetical protein